MKKNPFRILGIVFSSIAAVEAVVVICLLLADFQMSLVIAFPFAIQSLIFGGIGAGFLIYCHRKQQRRERIVANGYYEMATVVFIEQNPYVRINRHSPYIVVCHINRDGVLHEYRSDSLYEYPGLNAGDQVPVYLDRRDEKEYYVDVESAAPTIIRH